MRLAALVVVVVAACRSDGGSGGSRTVDIVAYAGSQPEPGATVISHTTTGAVIDRVTADAVGRASLGVDDGALVTVVFPGTISTVTGVVSVVTTAAPPSDVELAIYGPSRVGPPGLIVGVLELTGPTLAGADYFDVDVGCATVRLTRLPEYIDIGACSMGSDQTVDVLVRAYHSDSNDPPAPVFDGYAAGRAQMANGHAVLDLPAWQASGTPVPITLDGVSPVVGWTLYADGVELANETLTAGATFAYANLAVDAAQLQATLAGAGAARITDRYVAGMPQAIAFATSDFLPGFDLNTTITQSALLGVGWEPAPAAVDAINLHVHWDGSGAGVVPIAHRVVWNVVLPPEATAVSLPALDDDLGTTLAGTDAITQVDMVLRHIDSSEIASFAAVQTTGIHAEETRSASTIVPRPATGQVRIAHQIGFR